MVTSNQAKNEGLHGNKSPVLRQLLFSSRARWQPPQQISGKRHILVRSGALCWAGLNRARAEGRQNLAAAIGRFIRHIRFDLNIRQPKMHGARRLNRQGILDIGHIQTGFFKAGDIH